MSDKRNQIRSFDLPPLPPPPQFSLWEFKQAFLGMKCTFRMRDVPTDPQFRADLGAHIDTLFRVISKMLYQTFISGISLAYLIRYVKIGGVKFRQLPFYCRWPMRIALFALPFRLYKHVFPERTDLVRKEIRKCNKLINEAQKMHKCADIPSYSRTTSNNNNNKKI